MRRLCGRLSLSSSWNDFIVGRNSSIGRVLVHSSEEHWFESLQSQFGKAWFHRVFRSIIFFFTICCRLRSNQETRKTLRINFLIFLLIAVSQLIQKCSQEHRRADDGWLHDVKWRVLIQNPPETQWRVSESKSTKETWQIVTSLIGN